MAHRKPLLIQIEAQGRATLALLPLVAGLPFLSDEAIAAVFGQTMSILNWTRNIARSVHVLTNLKLAESTLWQRVPRTKEEQRAYWREAKRAERRRKRE